MIQKIHPLTREQFEAYVKVYKSCGFTLEADTYDKYLLEWGRAKGSVEI